MHSCREVEIEGQSRIFLNETIEGCPYDHF